MRAQKIDLQIQEIETKGEPLLSYFILPDLGEG